MSPCHLHESASRSAPSFCPDPGHNCTLHLICLVYAEKVSQQPNYKLSTQRVTVSLLIKYNVLLNKKITKLTSNIEHTQYFSIARIHFLCWNVAEFSLTRVSCALFVTGGKLLPYLQSRRICNCLFSSGKEDIQIRRRHTIILMERRLYGYQRGDTCWKQSGPGKKTRSSYGR